MSEQYTTEEKSWFAVKATKKKLREANKQLKAANELVEVALELEKVFSKIHQNHWPIVALTAINNLFIPVMEYRKVMAAQKEKK